MHPFKYVPPVFVLAVLVTAGCSGSDTAGRKEVYEVSGKVTMSGGPVANAAVTFSPKEGQPVAMGRTDEQGQYTLTTYEPGDGAAAGEYAVLVTKSTPSTAPPPPPPPHGPDVQYTPMHSGSQKKGTAQAPATGLPAQYSDRGRTPLSATVKPDDENVFDFELTP